MYKFIAFSFSSIAVDDFLFDIRSCSIKQSFLSSRNKFIPYKIVQINQVLYCFFFLFCQYFFSFFLLSLSTTWSAESFFDRFLHFFGFLLISSILISFFSFSFWCFKFFFFGGGFGGFISVLISTFTFVFLLFFLVLFLEEQFAIFFAAFFSV